MTVAMEDTQTKAVSVPDPAGERHHALSEPQGRPVDGHLDSGR